MNGQTMNFSRYYEQLKTMEEPIINPPAVVVDLCALSRYAKEKGVPAYELSDEDKARFIKPKI